MNSYIRFCQQQIAMVANMGPIPSKIYISFTILLIVAFAKILIHKQALDIWLLLFVALVVYWISLLVVVIKYPCKHSFKRNNYGKVVCEKCERETDYKVD